MRATRGGASHSLLRLAPPVGPVFLPVLQFSNSWIPGKWNGGLLSIFRYFHYQFCHLLWYCKNDLYCEYHENILTLISYSRKISCKKNINFEWMPNFVQNLFRIDTKMMWNYMQKSHFVLNHATVAHANWLFRGNLNAGPSS